MSEDLIIHRDGILYYLFSISQQINHVLTYLYTQISIYHILDNLPTKVEYNSKNF